MECSGSGSSPNVRPGTLPVACVWILDGDWLPAPVKRNEQARNRRWRPRKVQKCAGASLQRPSWWQQLAGQMHTSCQPLCNTHLTRLRAAGVTLRQGGTIHKTVAPPPMDSLPLEWWPSRTCKIVGSRRCWLLRCCTRRRSSSRPDTLDAIHTGRILLRASGFWRMPWIPQDNISICKYGLVSLSVLCP